jgi:hypothetical protein
MSFEEVILWLFGLFLLIGLFGHLENLFCETLELIIVLGLVLSQDTYAIQEAFKFTRCGPVLLIASRLLHIVDRMICLPLLIVTLG